MPITATDPVTPDNLGIAFHVDTGTLYVGNQAVTGFATRDMIEPTVYATTETLGDRIQAVEQELDRLKHLFTAEFAREIAEHCELSFSPAVGAKCRVEKNNPIETPVAQRFFVCLIRYLNATD